MIAGTQAIAMPDQELFSASFKFFGLKINRHIKLLLKIIPHPHIVVTHKKMHRYPGISQFAQLSKMLGHSELKTTQIYAKIVDEKIFEAVNKIPDINL